MPVQPGVCVYNDFDVETLSPSNDQTARRLEELGLERLAIRGKTVLDIGCNNGFVSLLCAQTGAARVYSVDVNPALVELVKAHVEARRATVVRAEVAGFADLDPSKDQADVVFFLEVLHWVVAQGTPVKDAIRKLWALTREVLVLEFPWSVSEPSIRVQTSLTEEDYSSQLILEWLTRCFDRVEFGCFNTYFQGQPGSCRALVIASGPKRSVVFDDLLPGLSGVERQVGANLWRASGSGHGAYAVKRVGPFAPVMALPRGILEAFVGQLAAGGQVVVPRFMSRDGEYLVPGPRDGARYLAYPWVPSAGGEAPPRVALEVAAECAAAGISTYEALDAAARAELDARALAHLHHSVRVVSPAQSGWAGDVPAGTWSINHGDVHTLNVLVSDGRPALVDFDTCNVGLRGLDLLWSLVLVTEQDPGTVHAWVGRWRELAPAVPHGVAAVVLRAMMAGWEENWSRLPQADAGLRARMNEGLHELLGALKALEG